MRPSLPQRPVQYNLVDHRTATAQDSYKYSSARNDRCFAKKHRGNGFVQTKKFPTHVISQWLMLKLCHARRQRERISAGRKATNMSYVQTLVATRKRIMFVMETETGQWRYTFSILRARGETTI